MHADEIQTDEGLMRRLLRAQFPEWAELPIALVPSYGTDHDIYRLGDGLAARLPRIGWATGQATKEAEWLPKLAPHLPLSLPAPMARGRAGEGYPFDWSVVEWLPGESASSARFDLETAAVDLAAFVRALRAVDTRGAPERKPGARGAPLAEVDVSVRRAIRALGDRIDAPAATHAWDEAREAAPSAEEVWVHGDLLPGNLIVADGRLSAVIDFGGLNVGDPACDLQPAWNVFDAESRERYRHELAVDDDSWLRGRGWALFQALAALPYYWDTNPGIVRQARHALGELLGPGRGVRQSA